MIAVAGEALIDLIADPAGTVDARPGGGPFNVARTLARLGCETGFLGRFSTDTFGRLLRAQLQRDGVNALVGEPVPAPTTLAVVDVSPGGTPRYHFHLSGTAACALAYPELADALPATVTALHIGSLGLVMEPTGTSIERLALAGVPAGTLVMLDPNCRPDAIAEPERYRERIWAILRRADVVKVSTEDLAYLCPDTPAETAAAALLRRGPGLVLVTDGPRTARAFLPGGQAGVQVPPARVVDTIGAGDAFGGAFLAWWLGNRLGRPDLRDPELVTQALRAAAEVASLTCTRAGAEPPTAADLATRPGWGWLPTRAG